MAGTVAIVASIKVDNGNLAFPKRQVSISNLVQDAVGGPSPGTVTIGTSEIDVDLSELTTEGWVLMINTDSDNYVDWGAKDTTMKPIGRMEAGEPALFRMYPGATLRMQANTAACKVEIYAFED